jgi:hypothetical protein
MLLGYLSASRNNQKQPHILHVGEEVGLHYTRQYCNDLPPSQCAEARHGLGSFTSLPQTMPHHHCGFSNFLILMAYVR